MGPEETMNKIYKEITEKTLKKIEKEKETDFSQDTLELISLTLEIRKQLYTT